MMMYHMTGSTGSTRAQTVFISPRFWMSRNCGTRPAGRNMVRTNTTVMNPFPFRRR